MGMTRSVDVKGILSVSFKTDLDANEALFVSYSSVSLGVDEKGLDERSLNIS